MITYTYFKWADGSESIKRSDNVWIPFDTANVDYQKYLEWLSQGNQPEQPDA
jgi:hypothetical protein